MGKDEVLSASFANWSRVGFSDGNGAIGMRVPAGKVFVPGRIDLDPSQRSLKWSFLEGPEMRALEPANKMLNGFVRLWKGTPESVCRFANKWGILWLDTEGRPAVIEKPFRRMRGEESIDTWQYMSRRAFSVLNIAASLRNGKPGMAADWLFLTSEKFEYWDSNYGRLGLEECWVDGQVVDLFEDEARIHLERELNLWLRLGVPSFRLRWSENLYSQVMLTRRQRTSGPHRWELQIDYDGCLFTAIALQLALTVARADMFVCSGCKFPYLRPSKEKPPRAGQRNFCEDCRQLPADGGPGTPLKKADERRREKIRTVRQLHGEGLSIGEILRRVDVRSTNRSSAADTVRRWIERGK